MSIDQTLNDFFAPISAKAFEIILYSVPIFGQDVKLLLVWLTAAAIFFTFYFGFINVRYFKHAIDIVTGKFDKESDVGQINSWQALMASMSGTVGLGNIAGVALAISIGGPGATFWMIILGFLSMSTKFIEVTLGVKYRQKHTLEDGTVKMAGGPMYYLQEAFDHYKIPYLGKFFSILFAICAAFGIIGGACLFQANQSFQQVFNMTGGDAGFFADKAWLFGLGLAILVGVVVIGGIKSIADVASRLVPAMGVMYVVAALIVIAMHYQNIPSAIGSIFAGALTSEAGLGGILGVLLIGAQRAAFSNESGMGTAPIVYAAAKADHPVTQGLASMLGPVIDTVIICTMTALLILISGAYDPSAQMEGVELTSRAFEQGISWFPYILTIAILLFAYSTIITFAYISSRCVAFLFGENKWTDLGFKLFYCSMVVVGAAVNVQSIVDFMDASFLSLAIPNIVGLYLLAPVVKKDLKEYLASVKA